MLDALTFDAGSTLTPDYMLMLDSRDITGNISDRLMSMTLTDNRGFEADQLDIELNDALSAFFKFRKDCFPFYSTYFQQALPNI